jgi:calcineurin-like phosphoesterase
MALLTTLQKLESVQATITAIEDGAQSYTHGGKTFTKADLRALYSREERLLAAYNAESGRSGRNYVSMRDAM